MLFQSEGQIRVIREVGKVMCLSCLVPNIQVSVGSAIICGCFSWPCLDLVPKSQLFFPDDAGIFQDNNAMIHWVCCELR